MLWSPPPQNADVIIIFVCFRVVGLDFCYNYMCITVVSVMRLLGVIRVVRAPIIEVRVLLLLRVLSML